MHILAILDVNVVPVGDITAIQHQSCGFKKLCINGLRNLRWTSTRNEVWKWKCS